jgi:hypothetical protein
MLVPALNRTGWLTATGLAWTVGSLGPYLRRHAPELWDEIRAYNDVESALWQAIRARFAEAEALGIRTEPALAEFFNSARVRTPAGRYQWNLAKIHNARTRLGLVVNTKALREARKADAKRIHDGMARHDGINREPFNARVRASRMAEKGAVTPTGLPMTELRLRKRYLGARRGWRAARYWSKERLAELAMLIAAGRSDSEIAWELGISKSAVSHKRWEVEKARQGKLNKG